MCSVDQLTHLKSDLFWKYFTSRPSFFQLVFNLQLVELHSSLPELMFNLELVELVLLRDRSALVNLFFSSPETDRRHGGALRAR